ncbi:hypothetical protein TBR22_A32030 [Luteitalea sp. TBR-22]|uniref:hypothetical protein n=1 Tax=Luteitalea sp. TBR-22 TaxID=2802971 RepID=UPI001AF26CB8|nr:hypothetical protein [Luteitalea sp. TBR-22]BCS33974.1 hypothetical protein TBR22_A32030 [Luteitalea sp. TBR-22]
MLTADIFRTPETAPIPPTYAPDVIDHLAGFGPTLPADADLPHAEAFSNVVSLTAAALADLAAVPPETIEHEVGRRVTQHLQDFRGAASVKLDDMRTKARVALSREVAERRAARMAEVKTQVVAALHEGTRALDAAYTRRRQVPIPPPAPGADPTTQQLLDTQQRILAALDVPADAAPEVLLRHLTTNPNAHARQRAQDLLGDRLAALRADAGVAKAQGRPEDAKRLQALAQAFHDAVEGRIPPHVREAERATADAWQAYTQQARRLLRQITVAERAGVPMDQPIIPPALAEQITTTLRDVRTAAREAWRPVLADVRQARLLAAPSQGRG